MATSPSSSYVEHVARLERRLSTDQALHRAVGGEFIATGKLEYHLLRSRGLRDDHLVVDVGCGSGRLACQLAPFAGIRYIGSDIVPRLLEYARELCLRPDWHFEQTNGTSIPCGSGQADFVCFFSVFTHLPQEDIYRYFREAYRVLKPGGLLILSFLELRVPTHWNVFIASVDGSRDDEHLNQFIEREAIQAWSNGAGFEIRGIHAGNSEYIPLPEEIQFEDGSRTSRMGSLGQSIAVLQKCELASTPAPQTTHGEVVPAAVAVVDNTMTTQEAPSQTPRAALAPIRNASVRVFVARGRSASLGFTVGDSGPRRVLVRAVGPSLSAFGVLHPLPRPSLTVHSPEQALAENAGGWAADPAVRAAAASAGAFTLASGSEDAALVITLQPGNYTALARSATDDDEGEVVVEVYLLD